MKRTPLKRGKPLKRRKFIRRVSKKREELLEAWAEIKREKLQEQRDERGETWCEGCGTVTARLELDHIIPAGKGGPWRKSNAQLLCAGPGSCHRDKHGEPQWSR